MINNEDIFKLVDSFIIREEDKVLFDFKKNSIFEFNETAFDIILCLDGKKSIKDIAEELSKLYIDDYEIILSGIKELIRKLIDDTLIERVEKINEPI